MSFRYPDHPNTNRTDPFQDADGKNPFADGEATPEKAADNPYAASPANEPGFASADPYQVVYPHRGRSVFWLGVVGCCCALGAVLAGGGSLATPSAATVFLAMLCLLLLIVSLTAGGTAWMFGRLDLRAIRAGAMDSAGMKMTRRGHLLGLASTLVSIGTLAALVVATVVR
jgi:hypothetical protein